MTTLHSQHHRWCILQFNQQRNADRLEAAKEAVAVRMGCLPEVLLLQEVASTEWMEIEGWRVAKSALSPTKSGGFTGSAVAIRPGMDLEVRTVPHTGPRLAAAVVTSRGAPGQRILFVSCYVRPPEATRHGAALLERDLLHLFRTIQHRPQDRWVVAGDVNLRNHPWTGVPAHVANTQHAGHLPALLARLDGRCVTPVGMVTMLTYQSQTTIDLTFVGRTTMVSQIGTVRLTQERDHLPITFFLEATATAQTEAASTPEAAVAASPTQAGPFGSLQRIHWPAFTTHLGRALDRLAPQATATDEWRGILRCLQSAVHQSRPKQQGSRPHRVLHSWWNEECEAAARAVRETRRQIEEQVRRQPENDQAGMEERVVRRRILRAVRRDAAVRRRSRELGKAIHKAKSTVLLERIGQLDGKRGWQAVAVLRGKPARDLPLSPPLRRPDGTMAATTAEKVELLVQSLFPMVDAAHAAPAWEDMGVTTVDLPPVTLEEVLDAAREMATDKASGPDGMPPQLLRQAILLSLPFRTRLTGVINRLVVCGEMPADWVHATISVLPKPGADRDLQLAKSYRPISLLNVASKLVDAILTRRLHYLAVHEAGFLALPHHFGTVPGVSTVDAIGTLIEKGRNALRSGYATAVACIDVGGAFNNIDHRQLVAEVQARGQPAMAQWLAIWLRQRTFTLRFEGTTSRRYALGTRGVPQGSPLSPILWTLYLDSFFQDPAVHGMDQVLLQGGYVDDLFVLAYDATPAAATMRVQAWLDRLYAWCDARRLTLDKPSFLVDDPDPAVVWRMADTPPAHQDVMGGLGDRPRVAHPAQGGGTCDPPTLRLMDGSRQRPQSSLRILGVHLGARFSTTAHTERVALSVISMVRALHRSLRAVGGLTLSIRMRIVQAVCHATLDYACPALLPLSTRSRQALLAADRAMFRLIFAAPLQARMPSAPALAQELGWLLTEHRWWRLALRHTSRQLGAESALGEAMRQRASLEAAERGGTAPAAAGRALAVPLLAPTDVGTPFSPAQRRGRHIGGRGRGTMLSVGPWRYALAAAPLTPVEGIGVPSTPPWDWQTLPTVIMAAAPARKTALALQERLPAGTALVWTDGSRKEVAPVQAGVGAAAYGRSAHPPGVWTYRQPLPSDRLDIFDAELLAIQLGLQACLEISRGTTMEATGLATDREVRGRCLGTRWRRIEVLSDSQAALQRLQAGWKRDRSAGQQACQLVRETWRQLQAQCPGVQVTLRWVPSHCGVAGNEAADQAANAAAEGPRPTPTVAYSQAKARQEIDQQTEARAQATWQHTAPGHRLVNLAPQTRPTQTYAGLGHRARRILLAWRCNMVPPSDRVPGPGGGACPCGHAVMDRDHLLLGCSLLERQRQAVQRFFPPSERQRLDCLLAGGGRRGESAETAQYLAALERWLDAAWRQRYPRRMARPPPGPEGEHGERGGQRPRSPATPPPSSPVELVLSSAEEEDAWDSSPSEWEPAPEDDARVIRERHWDTARRRARQGWEEALFTEEGAHTTALQAADAALRAALQRHRQDDDTDALP